MKKMRPLFAALVIALLTGCATSRSVVAPAIDAGRNPAQGVAVRIENVTDARTFQARPPQPDMPSLNEQEVGDRSLTARAVGRKRNGFGQALGDIVLPENESVAKVVSNALTKGLRESGYRVLAKGETGYEQAAPVSARVEQFWAWINPGFAAIRTTARIEVALAGNLKPIEGGKKVTAEAAESMQIVTENDWLVILNKALDAWIANLKTTLRP
jgi:uncharacterized lipoprotein YajG